MPPTTHSKRRARAKRRPIMVVLDALGRRWTLRVLWEMRDGPHTFRELRERCEGMSPSVLNERLHELRVLGLLDDGEHGYVLTPDGQSLGRLLLPLNRWAEAWDERRSGCGT